MAKVLIKVNVAYPGEFQKVFNSQASIRQHGGELGCILCVDDLIHNHVYLMLDWESESSAHVFWATPAAKASIKAWRSVEVPQIKVLRDSLE